MKLFEVFAKNIICMLIIVVCGLPTKLTGTEVFVMGLVVYALEFNIE